MILESDFVSLLSHGSIATTDAAEGRAIPVLIIDCIARPDLYTLIMNHQSQPPGDVKCTWGRKRWDSDIIYLLLEFQRPTPARAAIQFNLTEHMLLVDQIFQTNAAYLQPNTYGGRVVDGLDKEKIVIEIPTAGAPFEWDKLLEKKVVQRMRATGLSRTEARGAVRKFIAESRRFTNFFRKS